MTIIIASLIPRLSRAHERGEGKKESLVHSDRKFHHVRLLPPGALLIMTRDDASIDVLQLEMD